MILYVAVVTLVLCILLFLDWKQTRKIAMKPEKWTELNPLLGPHPSVENVNLYFAIVVLISIVGPFIGLAVIPEGVSQLVAAGLFTAATAFEAFVVWRNRKHGL